MSPIAHNKERRSNEMDEKLKQAIRDLSSRLLSYAQTIIGCNGAKDEYYQLIACCQMLKTLLTMEEE